MEIRGVKCVPTPNDSARAVGLHRQVGKLELNDKCVDWTWNNVIYIVSSKIVYIKMIHTN